MSATPVRPHLALHVCCGPCASAVIERLAERYRVHLNSVIDALDNGAIESDMRYLSGLKEIDATPVVDANKKQNPQQAKKKRIEGGKADGAVTPRGPQQAKKKKPGDTAHPRGPQQAKKK